MHSVFIHSGVLFVLVNAFECVVIYLMSKMGYCMKLMQYRCEGEKYCSFHLGVCIMNKQIVGMLT